MTEINLKKYLSSETQKYFNGRPEGKDARNSLKLDEKDKKKERITFSIDADLVGMNVSFFLGLFGPTILQCGINDFKERYNFKYATKEVETLFKKDFEYGIKAALREITPQNLMERLQGK